MCVDKIGWIFGVIWQEVFRAAHVGIGISGSGSIVSGRFWHNIMGEMVLGSWRIKLNCWGGCRFIMVVVRLKEILGVLYCIICSIEEIIVGCRIVDKVIRSSVLNILIYVFRLEVNRHRV